MPEITTSTEVTIEFEVYCSCGNGLCGQSTVSAARGYRGVPHITIEPCEKCLKASREEGYDEGYADKEKEMPEVEA